MSGGCLLSMRRGIGLALASVCLGAVMSACVGHGLRDAPVAKPPVQRPKPVAPDSQKAATPSTITGSESGPSGSGDAAPAGVTPQRPDETQTPGAGASASAQGMGASALAAPAPAATPSKTPSVGEPSAAATPRTRDEPGSATAPPLSPGPPVPSSTSSPKSPLGPTGILALQALATPADARVGDLVTVSIVASASVGIVDAPFDLVFDPVVLSFVDAAQGDFLSQDGGVVVFMANGTAHAGDVAIGIGRTERSRGVAGSGVLARVRFRAIAPGRSTLSLKRSLGWDADGNRTDVVAQGTDLVVR